MQDLPIELLARLLPPGTELDALRDAILAGSISDPTRRWSASASFVTLDKRVVPGDAFETIFGEAEARAIAHIRSLYAGVHDAVVAFTKDDPDGALARLTELGERAIGEASWNTAIAWFSTVLPLAEQIGARERVVLASRRIGLAHLHLGNVSESRAAYERALREAEVIGNGDGCVIANIGLAHVLCLQGRWQEAQQGYSCALGLNDPAAAQRAAQIQTNLSMTARETGDLAQAAAWLDEARKHWESMSRGDRSVWYNNEGMLLLDAGGTTGARTSFENALAHSPSHFDTAMILDNLAELALREGSPTRAEAYARRAEEFALAGAAPRALVEIYIRLALILRMRGEEDGVGLLEKALELCRTNRYLLAEASVLDEYALLREQMRDPEAAAELRQAAAALRQELQAQ